MTNSRSHAFVRPRPHADRLPRVLIVAGNPINRHQNNGLYLSGLFEGWPMDRLAQVFAPTLAPLPPGFDVCRTFWKLTPLGLQPVPAQSGGPNEPPSATTSVWRRALVAASRWQRDRLLWAYTPLREALYSHPLTLRGPAMRSIEHFAPDVIFTTLATLSIQRTVRRLAERLSVPIVPCITDDWITTEYAGVLAGARMRRAMHREFEQMLRRAPVGLTISEPMAQEYSRRYGGTWLPFGRCVSASDFPEPPRRAPGAVLELVYAGNLAIGRWRELAKIGDALDALRGDGLEGRLTVYTTPAHAAQYGAALARHPAIRIAGTVSSDALPAVYAASDVTVHVESFDPAIAEYTRFSLSSKLAELLMAGRPVLGVGPADGGSIRHIAASGGGVVSTVDDPTALRGVLRALLQDADARQRLGAAGRAYAEARHECGAQRTRFRDALVRAAHSAARGAA